MLTNQLVGTVQKAIYVSEYSPFNYNTAAVQQRKAKAHTFKYFRMTSQFRLRSPVPRFSDNFYGRHQPQNASYISC